MKSSDAMMLIMSFSTGSGLIVSLTLQSDLEVHTKKLSLYIIPHKISLWITVIIVTRSYQPTRDIFTSFRHSTTLQCVHKNKANYF